MVDFPPDRATANTSQQLCGLNSRFLFFSLTIPICYGTVENGKEQFIVLSQGSQLRNSISLQAPHLVLLLFLSNHPLLHNGAEPWEYKLCGKCVH